MSARIGGLPAPAEGEEPLLEVEKTSVGLPAAGEATIVLRPRELGHTANGDYSGRLVVSEEASDTVLRLPISIAVPKAAGSPVPALGAISLAMTRNRPWDPDSYDVAGDALPLRIPAAAIGNRVDLSETAPLGYVQGDRGIAAVFWNRPLEKVADGTMLAASLEVRDVPGVGEYEGTIDLLPAADDGEVAVTVSVTDAIGWAVAALLAGILAAFAVKRWLGVKRVQGELEERLVEINEDFANARTSFVRSTAGQPYGAYDLSAAFATATGEATTKIDALAGRLRFTVDKAAHDSVTALLGKMREAADSWAPFGRGLGELSQQLAEIEAGLPAGDGPDGVWPSGPPAVLRESAALLKGGKFESLEAYSECRATIAAAADLLAFWAPLQKLLARYRAEQERLLRDTSLDPARVAKLRGLTEKMRAAANELWAATDESELAERKTQDDLLGVEAVLSTFQLQAPTEEEREAGTPALGTFAESGLSASIFVAPESRARRVRPSRVDWSKRAKELRRRRFAADVVVAAGAAALALLAGLDALYFDKEFGTWRDYLAALLWGGTAEGVLAGLQAALGRLVPLGSATGTEPTVPQLARAAPAGRPGRSTASVAEAESGFAQ